MFSTQDYYVQLLNTKSINIPLVEDVALEQYRLKYCVPGQNKALGFGSSNPLVCFVCLEPNDYDLESGKPFTTKSGEKVFGITEYLNRNISLTNNTYYTCLFSDKQNKVDEMQETLRFIEELGYVSPRYIILFGEECYNQLSSTPLDGHRAVLTLGGVSYHTFVLPDLNKLFFQPSEYREKFKAILDEFIEVCSKKQSL